MKKTIIRLSDVAPEALDLRGQTIVFTGGTDGMGRLAVEKFAELGARVVLLGRNPEKTRAVADALNAATASDRVEVVICDLARLDSVRAAADEVRRRCPSVDVLVNCAGANFSERQLTEDGLERCWTVNHLGGLLLTLGLLDRLRASAPARVVHLSSATEKYGRMNLDDLSLETNWAVLRSYAQAKLAVNMCTRRLAEALADDGVTVNALNPGWIKTGLALGRDISGWRSVIGAAMSRVFAEPIQVGADRIVTLAVAPQYADVTGAFVYEDHVRAPNPLALDEALVDQVWATSLEQVGFTAP